MNFYKRGSDSLFKMSRRSKGKIPIVPAVPDILHPKPVGQEEAEFDEEDRLEAIARKEELREIRQIRGEPLVEGPRFVHDLGIGNLLQECTELCIPQWSKKEDNYRRDFDAERRIDYTHSTVSRIIEKIFIVPSDIDTANYRLDVFGYLLTDQHGFENFNGVFKNLNSLIVQRLQRDRHTRDEDIWTRVANYGLIFDITENYVPFGEHAPEALQRMDVYFEALKKSHSHRKMGELASKLSQPHDINLRIRTDPRKKDRYEDNYPRVVSASVVKASEFAGEFGDEFILDSRYEIRGDREDKKPVREILQRAIELKYDRHLTNTAGHIDSTLSLFEPMLIYMGYIRFMKQQQKRGVEFCRPEFSDTGEILDAKNPLVTTEPIIGNDIKYNLDNTIRVVTGPNNGGKTVYVKTVGMVHALAQRGFYVPASRAELRFVDDIYTHFVSPDDIANAEGRYKNEMRRMDEIFSTVTPNSLVILDEPCGGTTLESGVKVREGASPMHYGDFIPNQMGLDYNTLSNRLAQRSSEEGFSFDK